ncbi:MAG: DUF503 domain-containing protein [Clostridiales bacterium]|nr:DUF503 domain-containing protein [Clostridiales bacterium]
MVVGIVRLKIYAPWVHSLKEKRMIVKSLCSKIRNKFNVAVAEVEDQDIHQSIFIGFACISTDNSHADQIIDRVINFIEGQTEGEIVQLERELY